MQPQRACKIDLTQEYPCPCRRRGQLIPIALTEAFGCNRCQQIFVVDDNGHVLEQLSSSYPYKRAWRWTGHQWSVATSGLSENYLPLVALGITLVLLAIILPLAIQGSGWTMIALVLLLLIALIVLLVNRR